jgi:hypothetical protein
VRERRDRAAERQDRPVREPRPGARLLVAEHRRERLHGEDQGAGGAERERGRQRDRGAAAQQEHEDEARAQPEPRRAREGQVERHAARDDGRARDRAQQRPAVLVARRGDGEEHAHHREDAECVPVRERLVQPLLARPLGDLDDRREQLARQRVEHDQHDPGQEGVGYAAAQLGEPKAAERDQERGDVEEQPV